MTLNNLGVFHIFEGLLKPDNSGHGATKLGIHYLEKAKLLQKSNLTMLAFGWLCFEANDFKGASNYFKQACELKQDYASIYNLGVSLYMQGKYNDATVLFEKALNFCVSSDYVDTYASYMFSLLHSDKKKCLKALHELKDDTAHMEMEKFILAYFCNELPMAERQIKPIFDNYSIHIQVMAIIFDCLFKLKKDEEAKEYLRLQVESLKGFNYNIEPEIDQTKKVFYQADYRAKVITGYQHNIPIIKQCCYYGCEQHNPL